MSKHIDKDKQTQRQKRAMEASKQFPSQARKPIVIEFAGVPKAGKTSTISQLNAFLKRCGFKVETVSERASACPIRDKKHVNFNIWTACTTLSMLLEKTQTPPREDDPQILILDRGIFDSLCWLHMMQRLNRLSAKEKDVVQAFLEIGDWRKRITGVVMMTVSPIDSMAREQGLLPVRQLNGSIMNPAVLSQMNEVCRLTANELRHRFRVLEVDTSKSGSVNTPLAAAELVADSVLDWIDELLDERVLVINRPSITELFNTKVSVGKSDAERLIDMFQSRGTYTKRKSAEADNSVIQALPIVVVKNAQGLILQLRRKERKKDNPLNEKIVIWAGGHVHEEDKVEGPAIVACAVRELDEELRLRVTPEKLALKGAIFIDEGKSARHVAIVYEWKSESNEVDIALNNAEFFERRGNSLSGKFVTAEKIVAEMNKTKSPERWSYNIVKSFLPEACGLKDTNLLL